MTDFLWGSCFQYMIALRPVYTIALYDYSPIMLYHFYLIVSREDCSGPPGGAAPHPAANG